MAAALAAPATLLVADWLLAGFIAGAADRGRNTSNDRGRNTSNAKQKCQAIVVRRMFVEARIRALGPLEE